MELDNFQFKKWPHISGRYLVYSDLEHFIESLNREVFDINTIGYSEKQTPIHSISFGNGPIKVLMWTQMHGNEVSGTKALVDFLHFINTNVLSNDFVNNLSKKLTIKMIPLLNPDGAEAFTRVNSNQVDLNRDAVALQAKESQILRNVLDKFNPLYCFNLHDQRTIFNIPNTKNPATLSFLAPSVDEARTLTEGRKKTMAVVAYIFNKLNKKLPKAIGRYTDEFYPTATGDNFEKLGHHTILIEAGHYPNDYDREVVRYYNYLAIYLGLEFLAEGNDIDYRTYFDIPNNDNKMFDVLFRNVKQEDGSIQDLGFLYDYTFNNGQTQIKRVLKEKGDLEQYAGYLEFDLKGCLLK